MLWAARAQVVGKRADMPDPKATTKGLEKIHTIKPQHIQPQRSIAMENVPMLASFLMLSSCLSYSLSVEPNPWNGPTSAQSGSSYSQ